jgi:hypothetical protein
MAAKCSRCPRIRGGTEDTVTTSHTGGRGSADRYPVTNRWLTGWAPIASARESTAPQMDDDLPRAPLGSWVEMTAARPAYSVNRPAMPQLNR